MGGFAAFCLGVRLPLVFGRVFSQAGAFAISPPARSAEGDREGTTRSAFTPTALQRYFTAAAGLRQAVRSGPRLPIRVYLDVRTYDFLYPGVQEVRRLLEARGNLVAYNEFHAGHTYAAWREDLEPGLRWLFGPEAGR